MSAARLFRRPSWRTAATLLTATAIVGTGAGLSASGVLTSTAGHQVRPDRIHVAAADVAASAAAPAASATVPVGTQYYKTSDLSGRPSGSITDGSTSYPLTCRTDTGVKPVGIVIPGIGSVYVPGSSVGTTANTTGLQPCPTTAPGTNGSPKYAAEDCARSVSTQQLMEDFVKNWISNNAESWAGKLTAKGDEDPPAPANSQIVDDALQNASTAFYDEADAFLGAFKDALKDYPETYEDCQEETDGSSEPAWEEDAFQHMDDEDVSGTLREWLETAVDAIADTVADAAQNGISSDDCQHTGTSPQC